MQVFQRKDSVLGGIDEAIAILKLCAGHDGESGWDELEVHALHEGDEISPWETVMTIEGDYALFAHLETVYLGSLARRTLIMRNVKEVVEAANEKPILYFPARHDHWLVQTGDGWAAHVAGAIGVSTDAQASWWGGRGVGTVPHGLIAAYEGDTAAAAQGFADRFADQMNVVVLVDFENDSVRTALEVADALGDDLWGVRLDTSGHAGGPGAVDRDGRVRPDRRERAPGRAGARGAGRGRPRAREDRGQRRLRRRSASASSRRWARRSTPTAWAPRWSAAPTTTPPTSSRSNGEPCAKVGRRLHPQPTASAGEPDRPIVTVSA